VELAIKKLEKFSKEKFDSDNENHEKLLMEVGNSKKLTPSCGPIYLQMLN
jgi:hypothetical protein